MTRLHRIRILAYEGCQLLDVTGPAAVFGAANAARVPKRLRFADLAGQPELNPIAVGHLRLDHLQLQMMVAMLDCHQIYD